MSVSILFDPERVLLAGYILAVVCLNATMYLISAFYHKKFGEATPKAGFAMSIFFSILCSASVFVSAGSGHMLGIIQSALLIAGGGASAAASINLFLKMRKPRK